jgi:hypothetical protein
MNYQTTQYHTSHHYFIGMLIGEELKSLFKKFQKYLFEEYQNTFTQEDLVEDPFISYLYLGYYNENDIAYILKYLNNPLIAISQKFAPHKFSFGTFEIRRDHSDYSNIYINLIDDGNLVQLIGEYLKDTYLNKITSKKTRRYCEAKIKLMRIHNSKLGQFKDKMRSKGVEVITKKYGYKRNFVLNNFYDFQNGNVKSKEEINKIQVLRGDPVIVEKGFQSLAKPMYMKQISSLRLSCENQ